MTPECAQKLSKMIPRLAGDDIDVLATAKAMARVLEADGMSLHDLARAVELAYKPAPNYLRNVPEPRPAKTQTRGGRPQRPVDPTKWIYILDVVPHLLDADISETEKEFILLMRQGARHQESSFRMTEKQRERWTGILVHNGF